MTQQKADEQKIWSIMWAKMSPASQSKIQEMPNFEQACLERDCVLLWGFVRRTHLTHIYGEGDPMSKVNDQEAENRYNIFLNLFASNLYRKSNARYSI